MKKFRVVASYVTYCTAEIEAETREEAWLQAKAMDGGDFQADTYSGDDWEIEDIQDITEEPTK